MKCLSDNKESYLISKICGKGPVLVFAEEIVAAKRIAQDLSFYSSSKVYVFPEEEAEDFRFEAKSRELEAKRLEALTALAKKEDVCVIAPKSVMDTLYPSKEAFSKNFISIKAGESLDRQDIINRLIAMGYERRNLCESFGEFAVRGDIIDVFGTGMENPVRIELFDTEVDCIRSFDNFSQRSIENLEEAFIAPVRILDVEPRTSKLEDYIEYSTLVIKTRLDLPGKLLKSAPMYAGHMEILATDLKKYIREGYNVNLVLSSSERIVNIRDFLSREGIEHINLCEGSLLSGIEIPEDKIVYISENDIFPFSRKIRRKNKKSAPIKVFTDIKPGDYIVHDLHGIGQFTGVIKLTADGSARDYLKVQYAGKDVLYVPVDQMDSIQKYLGAEATAPRISKLSGGDWQTIKQRAKESIREMAEEYLKRAAKREAAKGFAFGPDSSWQKEFEDAFPYQETEDQLRSAEEIKQDMQKEKPMDRLLCGDVGYGKTEVAARAIFKCLEQGRQAAVLVPTTILANQHYHTFKDRFMGYPFNVEMLSRFKSDKEQEEIIKKLEKGEVDLVVGTHRVLSKDVKFKDLGLLVVDEEQRFGVEHKDAIKQLKENVDVLTLSATPIPRTLHMSLIGVRDMSILEQPPEDRYPVQTYVLEEDDEAISSAIKRELARGGQVYIVYNRVRGIQAVAKHIKELVPEASVGIGHGQMSERELEDIMMDFTEGKIQILIATTIIESGLDIPNVNTLLVLNADYFGLSQLYQLRGRVGRSNRMAYAFLFYKKDKQLSDVAEKRLTAIKEFTEFGSGFRIAMRDLELRGAGNLLGREQSGHMLSIGYEMYCKLVEEAVSELSGGSSQKQEFESDTQVELGVSAFIPEDFVDDELTRLDMYKKIASIYEQEDREEVLDEILDRFGQPPAEVLNLLNIAQIRNIASKLGINKVVKQGEKVTFLFDRESALCPEIMAKLMDNYGVRLTIYGGELPRISLHLRGGKTAPECLAFLTLVKEK